MNDIIPIQKALKSIGQDIDFDNFTDENTGKTWKTSQVLYCRLDWLKENLKDEDEEGKETIDYLQQIIEAIQKANIIND